MTILDKPVSSTCDRKDIEGSETKYFESGKRQYLPNRYLEDASGKRYYMIPTVWDKHH